MRLPLQLTFRNLQPSGALERRVRSWATRLGHVHPEIMGCRVAIEAPHRHHRTGNLIHVRIDLTVPGAEIVVGRDPPLHHAHRDPYVALRDAFRAARRQLEDQVRVRRHQVKRHPPRAPAGERARRRRAV
jgi:hypothetical protein